MNASGVGRSRWAAIGAAVAVCLGAGGIGITQAATSEGERAIYKPIEPCRLIDTRADTTVGGRSTPLTAGDITLSGWGAAGNCVLPEDTAGLSLNVTAVFPTLPTYLTLYPTGTTRTDASHLNPMPGDFATPNAVNVDLSATGQFNVFNLQGAVDLIIDVVGIYDDHNHDDRYYTKGQVEGLIGTGTPGDYYTEDETDDLLDGKADTSDVYTQAQVDAMMPFAVSSAPDADAVSLGTQAAADQVMTSVTVNAPAAGSVVLNYSVYVLASNPADPEGAGCSVGTGTTFEFGPGAGGEGTTVGEGPRIALGGTKLVDVAAGSSTTFNLVCRTLNAFGGGGSGTMGGHHPTLTAIYTPAP